MNFLLSVLFWGVYLGAFCILLALKSKNKSYSVGKLILAVSIPLLAQILLNCAVFFMMDSFIAIIFDITAKAVLSVLRVGACCMMYRVVTNSSSSLATIWSKDFRIWNIFSCISFVLSCIVGITENLYMYVSVFTTLSSKSFEDGILNSLLQFGPLNPVIHRLVVLMKILDFLTVLLIMIAALLPRKKEA